MAKDEVRITALEPVDNEVIDQTVATINQISREAVITHALELGKVIIENIYEGDLEAWRNQGTKATSYRKLAEHPGLQVSAAKLSRACNLYELDERLGVSTWKHLTASHFRSVFRLPEKDQKKLLDQAEEKELTVDELAAKARKKRKKKGGKRGRPPLPAFVKSVNKLEKLVKNSDEAFGELDGVENLKDEEVERLKKAVKGMKAECEKLEAVLEKRSAIDADDA